MSSLSGDSRIRTVSRHSVPSADAYPTLADCPRPHPPAGPSPARDWHHGSGDRE